MLHKPYGIFINQKRKKIILSIRGTQSIEDTVTDTLIEPGSLEEAGRQWGFNGVDRWAHSGMMRVAMEFRESLEDSQLLHEVSLR